MIREISTQLHTIFILVGPSGCGKSTFAERYLKPQLDAIIQGTQIVSSDAIRLELLGAQHGKHDAEMLHVSEQAFAILHAKVEALSSFPVNAPFIIVDTIGMNEDFRKDIRNTALKNQYHTEVIAFTYPDRAMYLSYLDESYNLKVVAKHITRLNKEVLRELGKKIYNRVHRVRGRDFENYKVVVENIELYNRCMLDNAIQYVVIGDVHGCLDELKELISMNKFAIDGNHIQPDSRKLILLGDIIDKGPQSRAVLEFICNNLDMFKIVLGNHENFILKYFHKQLDLKGIDDELIRSYFTSVAEFKDDPQAIAMLERLHEHATPFLRGRHFYVSHAACENKYLGKLDSTSQRRQRVGVGGKSEGERLSAEAYLAKYEETHAYLLAEATKMHPYHIFGHDAFARRIELKNKLGIDTGCVSGGMLSSVIVNGMDSLFFQAVRSKLPATEALARPPFSVKSDELKFIELTEYEIARINNLRANKVNFIAGTISPAQKDMDTNDLESLNKALDYYKGVHVQQVMLQIKYMGSRCTVYLFKDIEKSYATSRNGFLIKQVDLLPIYKALHDRLIAKMEAEQISMMIIDGELLPWAALGKNLIESEFKAVEAGITSEIALLQENGFEQALASLNKKISESDFEHESHKVSKSELATKYGHSVYSTYKAALDYSPSHIPLAEQQELAQIYSEQLALFGEGGDLEYKPFAILKSVHDDGRESLYFNETNEAMYSLLNDDSYLVLDLADPALYKKAATFFQEITENRRLEGIIIKPNDAAYIKRVAPYIKVRNKRYLSIIYGYDYTWPEKFDKLLRQKRVDKKLALSIKEYELGKKMLETSWESITADNKAYFNLVANMIAEENNERDVDPRL